MSSSKGFGWRGARGQGEQGEGSRLREQGEPAKGARGARKQGEQSRPRELREGARAPALQTMGRLWADSSQCLKVL